MAALDLAKLSHETLRLGHKEATLNAQIRQFGVRAFDLLGGWPNAENTMRKALSFQWPRCASFVAALRAFWRRAIKM